MLAKTFHIENSGFRYLPNPTMYIWSNKNFSLRDILVGYLDQIARPDILAHPRSNVIKALRRQGAEILDHINAEATTGWPSFVLLKALHHALKGTDIILTGKPTPKRPKGPSRKGTQLSGPVNMQAESVASRSTEAVAENPQTPAANIDPLVEPPETDQQKARRKMVQDVLRSHIQEVLSGLNQASSPSGTNTGSGSDSASVAPNDGSSSNRTPVFEDIDSATPEEKQGKLMQVYFQVIRAKVIKNAQTSERRRQSVATASPTHHHCHHPLFGGFSPSSHRRRKAETAAEEEKKKMETASEDDIPRGADVADQGHDSRASPEDDTLAELGCSDATPEDIWCTLVFRMICWLMLHDFDQMDVQKPKKELNGSRLRVYIA